MRTRVEGSVPLLLASAAVSAWVCVGATLAEAAPVTATTDDGVTIYGEPYFGDLDDSAPLILLFHQAGSNGRGEYASVASWLLANGFRAIAWDQRSGGDRYGAGNRTATGLGEDVPAGYCDAYADLEAALQYAMDQHPGDRVVLWGSSYSAALVFRLAAEHPEAVSGVIAFSPAAGGPMVDCRAREWVDKVDSPKLVLRPDTEMARESSLEQKKLLEEAGAKFIVVENGMHGSSMLIDERTEHDMSKARSEVLDWLRTALGM